MTVVGQCDHAQNRQRKRGGRQRAGFRIRVSEQPLGLGTSHRRVGTIQREIALEVVQVLTLCRGEIVRRRVVGRSHMRIKCVKKRKDYQRTCQQQCQQTATEPYPDPARTFHGSSFGICRRLSEPNVWVCTRPLRMCALMFFVEGASYLQQTQTVKISLCPAGG